MKIKDTRTPKKKKLKFFDFENDDDDSLTGFFFLLGGGRLTGAQDFFSCGAGGVGLAGLFSCRESCVLWVRNSNYGRSKTNWL